MVPHRRKKATPEKAAYSLQNVEKARANYHSKVKNFIQEEHVPTIDGLAIPARLADRPLNCIIVINLYTKLSSESCFNIAPKLLYTS